jgi:hypothetical protein
VLTLLEEVALLTIDPRTGGLRGDQLYSIPYALAGAVLFDLALAGRIDTDTEAITVVGTGETGQRVQDELLAELVKQGGPLDVRRWVEQTFLLHKDLEERALEQLVDRGLVRMETSRRLWVIEIQRFPMVDGRPYQLVRDRLCDAILGDAVPPTRDIMLVSLASACGLLGAVLTPEQMAVRRDRIDALSSVETIARNVSNAIASLYSDMARGLTGAM